MDFTSAKEPAEGVVERAFDLRVAGETVPGVLWAPAPGSAPRALIALGHGGAQHKKSPGIRERALRSAEVFGWAALAIDAPGHGDRTGPAEAERQRARTLARVRGEPAAPALSAAAKIRYLDALAAQAVPEWQAALDAVLDDGHVADHLPLAYWGLSQGSSIGIPLLAADSRFTCAVLGLAQLHPDHATLQAAAERVTLPLRFAFQWDDPIRRRDHGLALFDAFGSREKSLHVNPGGHLEIPTSEAASWDGFLERHLQLATKDT